MYEICSLCLFYKQNYHLERRRILEWKMRLWKLRTGYEELKERMSVSDKDLLEKYMEQAERVAFEEQQEVYLQGIMDAFQVLEGLGVIRASEKIENLIKHIENDSFNS